MCGHTCVYTNVSACMHVCVLRVCLFRPEVNRWQRSSLRSTFLKTCYLSCGQATHAPQRLCGGQRTTCGSQSCPPPHRVDSGERMQLVWLGCRVTLPTGHLTGPATSQTRSVTGWLPSPSCLSLPTTGLQVGMTTPGFFFFFKHGCWGSEFRSLVQQALYHLCPLPRPRDTERLCPVPTALRSPVGSLPLTS